MGSGNSSESSNNKSGNSSESSNNNRKFDTRVDSSDKNLIDPSSRIGGISILGDKNDSGKIDDKNDSGKIDDRKNNKVLDSLLKAGFKPSSDCDIDCRVSSGDKNKIGAGCVIERDSIVGDGRGYIIHEQPKRAAATTEKGGDNKSNNKVGANKQ